MIQLIVFYFNFLIDRSVFPITELKHYYKYQFVSYVTYVSFLPQRSVFNFVLPLLFLV